MKRTILRSLALLLLLASMMTCAVVAAEEGPVYVFDYAGILSDSQAATLEAAAEAVSSQYGCGVYIATLEDMADYGYHDIKACSEAFYQELGLGLGSGHDGILLIMSMADRDYALCVSGSDANYAFTDYGKRTLEDEFRDDFREDDWYSGFFDYLSRSEYMLGRAADRDPVDIQDRQADPGERLMGILFSVLLGLLIALLVCSAIRGRMRSVRTAADADAYVPSGGVQFAVRNDRFVRTTQTRVYDPVQKSSGGGGGGGHGGTTVNAGGFSHSSGKF